MDYEGADDLVGDYAENLSNGSTCIHTARALEIGTEVELLLSFAGLVRPIALLGVVRWSRGLAGASDHGIGIEFVEMEETLQRLAAVMEAIARRDPAYVGRVIRVLVVEDNPHVARLLREGLTTSSDKVGDGLAFRFSESVSGRDAIAICRSQRFDAAIIDVYLPDLDGAAVIRALREVSGRVPILAVSAGGDAARRAALGAGADLFLDKPMRLRQVIDSMRRLIAVEPDPQGTDLTPQSTQ